MKIIDIETYEDDIGVIKTIIEILNGLISEANADFIKDAKAYRDSFNKKKGIKTDTTHNQLLSHDEESSNESKNTKDIDSDNVSSLDRSKDKSHSSSNKTQKSSKSKKKSNSADTDYESSEEDHSDDESKKPSKSKKSSKHSEKNLTKDSKKNKTKNDDASDDNEYDASSQDDHADSKHSKKGGDKKKTSDDNKKQKKDKDTGKDKVKGKDKGKDKDKDKDKDKVKNKDKDKEKGKDKDKGKSKSKRSKEEDEETKREENRGEIKILTADPNQVMLTYITLKGSAFKRFIVHPDVYSVGLNLDDLYKYIKNVDKEGIMTIHIDSDDTQHIMFDVKNENAPSQESICELRVVNLSSKKDRKIEADVSMAVRINCQAFHKACKDLMQFSQYVEITCDPTQLAITCKGDLSNHKRIFKADGSENSIAIKVVKKENENINVPNIIRLVFDLKYINNMYKCSSLCGNGGDMEIYLNPDSVMFLKYGIKLMGEMVVGISPSRKKKEHIDNYDEGDDEYYQDDDEIKLI
jgi:hypothetical protein